MEYGLLQLWLFLLHDTPHSATDRAFPVIAARLWKSLPDDITTATSPLTFRHKLKTSLFPRSYDNVDSWLLDNLLLFHRFYFLGFLFFRSSCFNPMYCNVVLQCFCTYTALILLLWWWWWRWWWSWDRRQQSNGSRPVRPAPATPNSEPMIATPAAEPRTVAPAPPMITPAPAAISGAARPPVSPAV